MNVYQHLHEMIGQTPILELHNTKKKEQLKSSLFAKLEYYNPAGSVKDRVAKQMIFDAIEEGKLKPHSTIIEPTSGNTGIGLCAIGTALGFHVIIVMPDSMSQERMKLMKAYGAELFKKQKNFLKVFLIALFLDNLRIQVTLKLIS